MKDEMEKIPGCAPELAGVSRLLEEIRMPEEMGEAVLRCLGRTAGPAPDGSTAEADQPVSDRKPEEEPFEGTADLSSHLLQAVRNRESGPWKGLPEQIFLDTMGCFSRFVREHHRSYGTWGFDRGFWTTRQAEARLFRIGQLEYELAEENGEKQLQLHIPSDALLETDLLNKSVGEAREFLKQWRPEWKDLPLQLESWLLSPALSGLLPPSSRILRFQKAFRLTGTDPEPEDYLEWVFKVAGGQRKTVQLSRLPEDTGLQKKMKAYVISGGKVGIGTGIFTGTFQ